MKKEGEEEEVDSRRRQWRPLDPASDDPRRCLDRDRSEIIHRGTAEDAFLRSVPGRQQLSKFNVAGFAVAVNNGSAEPRYYVDHLHRQHAQLQQQAQSQRQQQQSPRYPVQMLSGHVPTLAAKETILEPPLRRDDLVYVHCATTEDEEVAEDEEEESRGLTRSRSWLCCPSDRRPDKTVPIQVEVNNDVQNAVSFIRPTLGDIGEGEGARPEKREKHVSRNRSVL